MDIYYIDGKFVPASEAVISVNDLALLRGYGVFDFLRTYNGIPFLLDQHIERLRRSAELIDIVFPWGDGEILDIVMKTLDRNKYPESNIRILVTGGDSPDGLLPSGKSKLLVMVLPLKRLPPAFYETGVKLTTSRIERLFPGAKSTNYIAGIRAMAAAKKNGAVESLYIGRGNRVLECVTSNFFGFSGDKLLTPESDILPGITRKVVLDIAADVYDVETREMSLDELKEMDEAFITSSNKEVLPVVQVDDLRIGNGLPGKKNPTPDEIVHGIHFRLWQEKSMISSLTKAVIDLDALAANIAALRRITDPGARFMAVVKADAYGHGSVEVSRKALENGADTLGVARIEEGKVLREAGITTPILVFGHVPESCVRDIVEYDLTATIYSIENARNVSEAAVKLGQKIRIHVKIDTGMGRLGYLPDSKRWPESSEGPRNMIVRDVLSLAGLPNLNLEGIYTHFATADGTDKHFASEQFRLFLELTDSLKASGLEIPIRHAANSGAIIGMPETHLDMVRAGIAIYGLYPSREIDSGLISLIPAMSLKTGIIHLKKVPAQFTVSYGCTYKTEGPAVIATVPVGYGDGYSRRHSSRGYMLVRGQRAPVIGRVCMDLTMLDVSHIPDISLLDEVVVFGSQGDESLPADKLADSLDTINYEIVTSVSHRVPRVYKWQRSEV